NVENFADFHRRSRQTLAQGNAVDVFRGDVVPAAFITHFINRENVRVIERGRGVGFLIETNKSIAISREFFSEYFELDLAAEFRVLSQINFPHAARAELLQDAITRNGG